MVYQVWYISRCVFDAIWSDTMSEYETVFAAEYRLQSHLFRDVSLLGAAGVSMGCSKEKPLAA
jgi:hypothetical protein